MIPSFARHSVVRLRARRVPDGLDGRLDWNDPERLTIPGWSIEPVDSRKTFDAAGDRTLSRWQAIGPAGADVKAGDRIEWNGDHYELDAEPLQRTSPSGNASHCDLTLKRRGAT